MSIPRPAAPKPRRMIAAAGGGIAWQTMLADLALILFMVTAAAMGQPPRAAVPIRPEEARGPSAAGEPVAVWRSGAGAPPLAGWLARQQVDGRLQLTISARYAPGRQAAALAQAGALARAAGAMGRDARIVIEAAAPGEEPGEGAGGAEATLAYDRPGGQGENGTRFAGMGANASNAQALP